MTLHSSSGNFEGDRLGTALIASPRWAGARAYLSTEKQRATPLRILRYPSIRVYKPIRIPALPSEQVLDSGRDSKPCLEILRPFVAIKWWMKLY